MNFKGWVELPQAEMERSIPRISKDMLVENHYVHLPKCALQAGCMRSVGDEVGVVGIYIMKAFKY